MSFGRFSSIDELIHYASENYDPVKAHEYYLRTRELQGRHSTKGFNQKQREGWTYAQAQVRQGTKAKIDQAQDAKKHSIEEVRAQAEMIRKEIAAKLRAFVEELSKQHSENATTISENAKQQRQAIADKLKADIAAIPPVPKGLSPARREKLQAERAEKIRALQGKAFADRQALDAGVASDRQTEQKSVSEARKAGSSDAAAQRAEVAKQLKDVVAKYIAEYTSAKEKITSESQATLDKEFKNIKTKVR